MSLETTCTHLIRYIEDRRGELRDKPIRTSWYNYLQKDLYAKKMLDRIVEEACECMLDKKAVKDNVGQLSTVRSRIISSTHNGKETIRRDHRIRITSSDDKMYEWVRGCVDLDVNLGPNYTANVRVLFG